ncbi:unnamed protein product, partial [Prorocentrum cordatum]
HSRAPLGQRPSGGVRQPPPPPPAARRGWRKAASCRPRRMALAPENAAAQRLLELLQAGPGGAPLAREQQPPEAVPEAEAQLAADLEELRLNRGAEGGRVLLSFDGEIFDVSAARDLFGPSGEYAALAGADATRCLGEMSLSASSLDDLRWEPDNSEEEKQKGEWKRLLRARYPIAGRLRKTKVLTVPRPQPPTQAPADDSAEGLRQRAAAAVGGAAMAKVTAPAPGAATGACPISGKEGGSCPMAMFGMDMGPAKPVGSTAGAASGFMAGKSLIATVDKQKALGGDGGSILYKLCPLHADDATLKVCRFV